MSCACAPNFSGVHVWSKLSISGSGMCHDHAGSNGVVHDQSVPQSMLEAVKGLQKL